MKTNCRHPITRWREARKPALSISEVAAAAGVDRTTLSKVENGHRDRLNRDACKRLVAAFPGELSRDELEDWSWSIASRRSRSS